MADFRGRNARCENRVARLSTFMSRTHGAGRAEGNHWKNPNEHAVFGRIAPRSREQLFLLT
jgi:hypothetical protein